MQRRANARPPFISRFSLPAIEAFPGQERGLRRCVGILRRIGAELRTAAMPRPTVRGMLRFVRAAPTLATIGQLPLTWLFAACRLSPLARAVIIG